MGRYGPFSFPKSRNQGSMANEWVVHKFIYSYVALLPNGSSSHVAFKLSTCYGLRVWSICVYEQLIKHITLLFSFHFSHESPTYTLRLIPTFMSFYPFLPILPCLWKAMLLSFSSAFLLALAIGYSCSKYCGCQLNGWLFMLSFSLVLILLKIVFNPQLVIYFLVTLVPYLYFKEGSG